MKPLTPLALSLALSITAVQAAPGSAPGSLPRGFDDNPTVVDAMAKANQSGKPVIVYYRDHDCQSCKALEGWLLRADIRQAFVPGYHFAVLSGSDLVDEERARWRATYSPRGAPSWVVFAADGSYLCTSNGGFLNATAALELHNVLTKAAAKVNESRAAESKVIEMRADDTKSEAAKADAKIVDAKARPRPCTEKALGI